MLAAYNTLAQMIKKLHQKYKTKICRWQNNSNLEEEKKLGQ